MNKEKFNLTIHPLLRKEAERELLDHRSVGTFSELVSVLLRDELARKKSALFAKEFPHLETANAYLKEKIARLEKELRKDNGDKDSHGIGA